MSSTSAPPDLESFREHWQDEGDAAFLYRILADAEPDAHRREIYRKLADVEDRHVAIWAALLAEHGRAPERFAPSARARLMAWFGRAFGTRLLLPMLLAEEGREVKAYLAMHRTTPRGAPGKGEALLLARESKEHAGHLASIQGKSGAGEPWHRMETGGILRNVIYGFNDGLTANFGLVAGMIGATVAEQHHLIIAAGLAGTIADALSMGASGYLAAKSEREVYEHEIAMERQEIELMPELERDELALIYEAKGMQAEAAHALATEVMADPARMLEEQVQEELGIVDQGSSPMREAWLTGTATALGAIIPVAPFLFAEGTMAIGISFVVSMASHFLVGAARSVFTGRSIFRSGMDMFLVGLGVAAVGYVVGEWIGGLL
ncbi:MAG TPA: VIT1/CCC1 transporter family protein [Gemmatimonadaceae bacterium]|nr:VIT1/CCC1 transporter family protein [Gemmatimonadaceae bacterium]